MLAPSPFERSGWTIRRRFALGALAVGMLLASALPAGASSTALAITTTALTSGEAGVAYSQTLAATGGSPPYTWSASPSPVAPGISFSSKGVLSANAAPAVDENVTFTVTDSTGASAEATLGLDLSAGPTITTTSLPAPTIATPYSEVLAATGGVPPYAWSVSSGPLPLGLLLTSAGTLEGLPAAVGTTTTTISVTDALGSKTSFAFTLTVGASRKPASALLVAGSSGQVTAYATPGTAVPQTDPRSIDPVVGIATDAAGDRYWLVNRAGDVLASKGATAFGSLGRRHLAGQVVGIAAVPTGTGYWVATSTGHVYGFGSVHSLGSVPARRLQGEIVGIAASPSGGGYWLASSTGRVYAFGTAHTVRRHRPRLTSQVVGIAAYPKGSGYWVVSANGRVEAFGAAPVEGSLPHTDAMSVVGIAAAPAGGYWLVGSTGAVVALGGAPALSAVEVAAGDAAVGAASAS